MSDLSLAPSPVVVNPGPDSPYATKYRLWQGIPGIERAPNGRLWAVWYSGGKGEGSYNYVVAVTSGDDGRTWSPPKLVIDPPGKVRAYDPTLWLDPDGRLWLSWAQSRTWYDGRAGVWAITTTDPDSGTPTWTAPRRLCNGVMMNKPTVLRDGTWLFPAAVWARDGAEKHPELARERRSNVYVSRDGGQTVSLLGGADIPNRSFDEHMVVERKDGTLWMLVRRNDGIGESVSSDGGRTWGQGKLSPIAHTSSRFFIRRMQSGRLLLVKHGPITEKTGRSHLTAYLSADDGRTWQGGLMLDERNGVSYPDGTQAPDGTVYVIYDRSRTEAKEILLAAFTEDDVMAGKPVSPRTRLRQLVNKGPAAAAGIGLRANGEAAPPLTGPGAILACTDQHSRVSRFAADKTLFTDRTYRPQSVPKALENAVMLQSSIDKARVTCSRAGVVFVATPSPDRRGDSQAERLVRLGFEKAAIPEFHMFGEMPINVCSTYQKRVAAGEDLTLEKWSVVLTPQGGDIRFPGPEVGPAVMKGAPAGIAAPAGEAAAFEVGARLFTNRDHTLATCPEPLQGCSFLRASIDHLEFTCTSPGLACVITPTSRVDGACTLETDLLIAGFEKTNVTPCQLFGSSRIDVCRVFQKQLRPGERFWSGKWGVLLVPGKLNLTHSLPPARTPWPKNRGELLYNGIRLPEEWPPRTIDPVDRSPMPVPYLEHVPAVIPIDVGRQLFVDHFLIEETTLSRTFHRARKHGKNPVLEPETELEGVGVDSIGPVAAPKDGGIWWDPDQRQFRMWYEAGWCHRVAYATSKDGLTWERPPLHVNEGTNQVLPDAVRPDSWNVVPDPGAADPAQRWKMLLRRPGGQDHAQALTSPDGLHWSEPQVAGICGDRTSMFYNPFRKVWVYSIRSGARGRGRSRHYHEHRDFLTGARWLSRDPVFWAAADELDPPDPAVGQNAQLYNLDAQAYESLMLGVFEIHLGPPNNVCDEGKFPKTTELMLAFSRDGFHWHRPDRRAFIPASRTEGAWDRGYVQPVGGICLVIGDRLWFYYTGFSGSAKKIGDRPQKRGTYVQASTGLAFLRRDGFASMDAGNQGGTLLTRPVRFSGKHLFVNVAAPTGSLRVEIVDEARKPIAPFTRENCKPVSADSTLQRIEWDGGGDLSALAGKPVRFRFHLTNGALYAFWVSPNVDGASHGYVGAGGPGFPGLVDTVGGASYGLGQP